MRSTMQDGPLLISGLLRHGQRVYGDSLVITVESRRLPEADLHPGGRRGPSGWPAPWRRLGVGHGDRVGTFAWNDQEHLEAYLAVPSMGAVLHTLNIRLFPEQLAYVDQPRRGQGRHRRRLARPAARPGSATSARPSRRHRGRARATPRSSARRCPTRTSSAAEETGYDWPELDERQAAAMCYTSGTTGNPKGVVYSHRSTWLHSFAGTSANAVGRQRAGPRPRHRAHVPRQRLGHALHGLHGRHRPDPAPSASSRPSRWPGSSPSSGPRCRCGVPTIWNDLLRYSQTHDVDLSSLRMVHGRRLGRAPGAHRGLPGPLRHRP